MSGSETSATDATKGAAVLCPCGSGEMFAACHGDRPPLHGWKEIAAALGVTERAAQRFAARDRHPLVVFLDASSRAWCPWSHVRDFKNLHHLPAHLRAQLQKRKTKRRGTTAERKREGAKTQEGHASHPEGESV